MSMIIYRENRLEMQIATTSPAATHDLFLRGISALMRYYILTKEKRAADSEGIAAIMELHQALEPDERKLDLAYTYPLS
jgi:hypothetical protein